MRAAKWTLSVFIAVFISLILSTYISLAQNQPDMTQCYGYSLYADSCIPPGMPVYSGYKSTGGCNNYSYRIEFDVFPNGGGHCTIMARLVEATGQFHILRDIHWSDYPNFTPPWPDSIHYELTGTGTTDGSVLNQLEWLVQPFCNSPSYFKHCMVWITFRS